MPLLNANLRTESTGATFTGGTDTPLSSLGQNLNEHKMFINGVAEGTLDRVTLEFKSSLPKPSATSPSGFTQMRSTIVIKVPKTLASGKIVVQTLRMQLGTDVESADAERLEIARIGSQILFEPEFQLFLMSGSVA